MNKNQILENISHHESMIHEWTKQVEEWKKQLENIKEDELDTTKYVNKYFIQDRYESGIRFMYVLDAEESVTEGELDFYGYGADYDEQCNTLEFYNKSHSIWFGDVKYGILEEVSRKEFDKRIAELVSLKIFN